MTGGINMGKIYKSVTELIGGTPILEANNFMKKFDLKANILVKLEYFNPVGQRQGSHSAADD